MITEYTYPNPRGSFSTFLDYSGQQIGTRFNPDYEAIENSITTRQGNVLILANSDAPIWGHRKSPLTLIDLENNTERKVELRCDDGKWSCGPISFSATADGGVVLLVEQRDAFGHGPRSIMKILNADDLPCCNFLADSE